MLIRRVVPVVVLLSFSVLAADRQENLPEVRMKTVTVAAFKNGLSFLVKDGTATLPNSTGRIVGVPRATLGSLWVAADQPGATVEELVAYKYSVPNERAVTSLTELLRSNTGKLLTVNYNGKEYSGEVIGLSEMRAPAEERIVPGTVLSRAPASTDLAEDSPAPSTSKVLLLKADGKLVAMNIDSVNLVTLPQLPQTTVTDKTSATGLRFRLKNAGATPRITMGYLQEGIGWTPSYMVRLKDDKSAQITMQAVLVNDIEDLQEANVFFVVGAPNFAFADKLSPLALEQSLLEFIGGENTRRIQAMTFSNSYSNQMVVGNTQSDSSSSAAAGINDPGGGSPEQDMFLYNLPAVTLAKGERGAYNLFSAEVGYEHLYEWEVEDRKTIDVYGNASSQYNRPGSEQQLKNAVWHSVVLKNSTRYPWTSAPAMVISGDKPVAQDLVRYTPKGAQGTVKLTVATDVRTNNKEVEVERKARAAEFYGNDYDVVTVEGRLKLTNFKSQPIRIQVTKQLVGTVVAADENGKTEKRAEELRGVNPNSQVTWELPLAPGVEKTITYRYQVYVRD